MVQDLPTPIARYFDANARMDPDAMLAPFADDAIVLDEGGQHTGRNAIRDWIQSATIGNRAVGRPTAIAPEDDAFLVEGEVSGDFPGSPIRLQFRFRLQDDSIVRLEIG